MTTLLDQIRDFAGPIATVVAAVLVAASGLFAAFVQILNWQIQRRAGRYKTYVETYKLAKDAGCIRDKDTIWMNSVLDKVGEDALYRPSLLTYLMAFIGALFIAQLVTMLIKREQYDTTGLFATGALALILLSLSFISTESKPRRTYEDFVSKRE